jgi:hypothetical protein
MDLKKSKRFTGIILKDGGCETEDVYDVGDGLYLNKCEIEQLKKSLEMTPGTIKELSKLVKEILKITNKSPYRWLDMDSVEAGEIRKLLKQAKFNNK